jgi:2,4-didehydro-3-deoxy-L-rhamnonate hydrolase
MRLIGYQSREDICIGRLEGDTVVRLAERDAFWQEPMRYMAADSVVRNPLTAIRPCSPLRDGAKVICIGLNYRDHALEAGLPIPEKPVVFSRWSETVICDGEPSPAKDGTYDWEAELGVIVGRSMLAVTPEQAREGVFGYCTFNDLTVRSLQMETAQWTLGKNTDRSGPMGPIVTVDESGDPADGWRVTTTVNGESVQDGNTADMIFSVPAIIAFVSRSMTLRPGDLIITGTPAGVGMGRKPPRYLQPGDTVSVEVGRLGRVTTPIVALP